MGSSFHPNAAGRPGLYSALHIGDKVVSPFTVSCGECQYALCVVNALSFLTRRVQLLQGRFYVSVHSLCPFRYSHTTWWSSAIRTCPKGRRYFVQGRQHRRTCSGWLESSRSGQLTSSPGGHSSHWSLRSSAGPTACKNWSHGFSSPLPLQRTHGRHKSHSNPTSSFTR